MVKRFCTIGWALTGLIVAAMLVGGTKLEDKELAFGYACRHLLGPGLVGLMVACVLAANMSTCSNFMVNAGALFTRNLYTHYIRPNAGDKELLLVGRLSGFSLTLLGVLFASERRPGARRVHVQRDDSRLLGHRDHRRGSVETGEPLGALAAIFASFSRTMR